MASHASTVLDGRPVTQALFNKIQIPKPVHPANLMVLFWAFICLVYFFGPIYLTPAASISTFLFVSLHLLMFIVGSTILSRVVFFKTLNNQQPYLSYITNKSLYTIISFVLCIGLIGAISSIYSKLAILGDLSFSSISRLRELRAQGLLHGGSMQSTVLSALAFLAYPAGFVGLVATIICYETIPRLSRILCFLFVISIILLAVCVGGRSPIMVLFLFIGASCYVRNKMGKSYTPRSLPLRMAIASLVILFFAYSSFIWVLRSTESGMSASSMVAHAENVWGAHPKEYLVKTSEWLNDPGFTQTILSTTFYFIQSLSISERLLSSSEVTPTMYGAYQIDLFAAFFRVIPGGADFLKNAYGILLDDNVYGFFTGAWAGLFIDFGVFSFLAALLWGYFAGKSWVNFKRNPGVLTGVPYVFWTYSIFISFVSFPFGFSNSFMIFIWFLFFSLASMLCYRYRCVTKIS
ncbi:MAG: hypothetical protein Q8M40_13375 [Legionella sp.]|nr:hypothetical protein [Legionella sp.]